MFARFWVTILFCFSLFAWTFGSPTGATKLPVDEALSFMKRFGYLEEGDGQSDALYSENGISETLKVVQKFGNIPQTGKIDDETLKLMKSPRCGVPDVIKSKRSKRYVLGPAGWNKRRITYYVANWSPSLGKQSVVRNIQKALDAWGKYARLVFERTNDNNADIIVAFGSGYHGDRYPFDGLGSILAHAFFPYEQQGLGGDIHFDNDEKWTDRQTTDPEDGTDFFTVAVHELGHSLGLSHSDNPSSIMFPYYKGFQNNSEFSLDYDDILGMYELYIRRPIEGDDDRLYSSTTSRYPEATTSPFTTTSTRTTQSSITSTLSTTTQEDDYETVDRHKNHDTTHNIPTTNSPSLPDICQGHFDAVATLRDELFVFKDEYIWRLRAKQRIEAGYPIPLHQMFPKLPKHVKKIDAAYQRPDGSIVLFTGNLFWVYDGSDFIEGSPRPLSDYGLPRYVDSIDAVQIWAKNGKTYLYRNDRFWRYNETTRKMDQGYPKHISRWRGVPPNIDAATTWRDGYTYFFKGKVFWKLDNQWVQVTKSSPLPSPQVWLGCPEDMMESFPHGHY